MDNNGSFKKHYSRLAKEGILKAAVCGLIAGFAASVISAFVALLLNNFNLFAVTGLLVSVGIGLAVAVASAPLLYYLMFRPKTKQIAERVDRLGLEERLITMLELEKDESYIAMRQREDAKTKLNAVNSSRLRFAVFTVPIAVAFAVAFVFSASMITATVFGWQDEIPWLYRVWQGNQPQKYSYVEVSYEAEAGGFIDENARQFVIVGQDAKTVTATPEAGYNFVRWSDGWPNAERTDPKIMAGFTVFAIFTEDPNGPEVGGLDNPNANDPGGAAPGESDGGFNREPGGNTSGDGGDEYYERNQVIDGKTYYRDVYDELYKEAMEILAAGGEIPPVMRRMIEAYFDIII